MTDKAPPKNVKYLQTPPIGFAAIAIGLRDSENTEVVAKTLTVPNHLVEPLTDLLTEIVETTNSDYTINFNVIVAPLPSSTGDTLDH